MPIQQGRPPQPTWPPRQPPSPQALMQAWQQINSGQPTIHEDGSVQGQGVPQWAQNALQQQWLAISPNSTMAGQQRDPRMYPQQGGLRPGMSGQGVVPQQRPPGTIFEDGSVAGHNTPDWIQNALRQQWLQTSPNSAMRGQGSALGRGMGGQGQGAKQMPDDASQWRRMVNMIPKPPIPPFR